MSIKFSGLDESDVLSSRDSYGSNKLTPKHSETFFDKLLSNLKDPTVIVLIVALGIISVLAFFGFAHWYEGVGIAAAVLIATGVATFSEHKNENSFQLLLEEASASVVRVYRSGHAKEIPSDDIVVGDILTLKPGDKVPADAFLLDGSVQVDQSSLTGESDTLLKTQISESNLDHLMSVDIHNPHHVFRGSLVTDGQCTVQVVQVGDSTFYGKIASDLEDSGRLSPLTAKLQLLAQKIGKYGTIGAVFIGFAFMFQKLFMDYGLTLQTITPFIVDAANWPILLSDFVTAVILGLVIIVVAVPEGLPMMIAIVLSLNMRKLLSGQVLVRKLLGIESAGSMNILFTDKTGTLTKGKLEVSTVITGYEKQSNKPPSIHIHKKLTEILKNTTSAIIDNQGSDAVFIGADRTETALLNYVKSDLDSVSASAVLSTTPFNSDRKYSSVCVDIKGAGTTTVYAKGAPEVIIEKCTHYLSEKGLPTIIDDNTRRHLDARMYACAGASMRLLAVAYQTDVTHANEDYSLPDSMVLVSVIAMRDELRPESQSSVKEAHDAGIQVVMVTGDRLETANAIASDVGLFNIQSPVTLTSTQLESMTDDEVKSILPSLRVVARAYPHQKSRLVRIAQEMGHVVGMTGDGVNDAAALKRADVGFAMGSGTEIAKEVGDIVLMDDNFSSITRSVLYGRTLFRSIRKFLVFQLTVNVSAILVAFLGPLFGFDLPLTMIQLLWINLIMDTLAALAFSGEAALSRYMKSKPIPRSEPLISQDMWSSILVNGSVIACLSIAFLTSSSIAGLFSSHAAFLTAFFAFFVFIHNFNKFNARTDGINLFQNILQNKGFLPVVLIIFAIQIIFTYLGGDILRTVALSPIEWITVLIMSLIIVPVDILRKLYHRTKGNDDISSMF